MVVSILDTDLYKLSMSYSYMKLFPEAEGEFEFNDRNKTVFDDDFVSMLQSEVNKMVFLRLWEDEREWCERVMSYIPAYYWEWLSTFHYDVDKIKIWLDDEKHLHITVNDKLYKVTLYEVPLLATVSEVYNKWVGNEANMTNVLNKLENKIEFANENKLTFSEFGTRRRFSYDVQYAVVKMLKEKCPMCVGTSNVYLAKLFDMKPIGTVAHEYFMFHAAMYGYREANYLALEDWIKTYDGELGTALTDTFTSDVFFRNMSLKQAKTFDGIRQDSGDEFEFTDKALKFYTDRKIDPKSKLIIFSNALDFEKYKKIADYCRGKVKFSAGIGTNLTNDTGFKPMNIVMKLMKCRMTPRQSWANCIKISDDQGKVMGDSFEITKAFYDLGLNVEK